MKTYLYKLALAIFVMTGIAACGGGGGGSSPATTPVVTITVKINPPSSGILYANRAIALSATGSSSTNSALTYNWTFSDGTTDTGASISHTFTAAGTYSIKVVATDGTGATGQTTAALTISTLTLSTPVITPTAPNGYKSNQTINFTGSATDPTGAAVSYAWNFGDGTSGVGATTSHAYIASGYYTVTLTASNNAGNTSQATAKINIDLPSVPVVNPTVLTTTVNKVEPFTATATDPNNLALTYSWDFGDGGTGTGASINHTYVTAGNYTVTVTATNTNGKTSSNTIKVGVLPLGAGQTLAPACSGANCGAASSTVYSGSGVGVWRYDNNTTSPQSVNIAISGVSAANSATLIFTNAGITTAFSVPSGGTGNIAPQIASNAQPAPATNLNILALTQYDGANDAHSKMLARNRDMAKKIISNNVIGNSGNFAPRANTAITPSIASPTPALNSTRSWSDNYDPNNPVIYNNVVVKQICTLASGRKAVFWVDPQATSSGNVKDSDVLALSGTYCAVDGQGNPGTAGFDKLVSLLGDAYGAIPVNDQSALIGETAGALQDINIVILNVPSNTGWGGYFFSLNNVQKTYTDSSNFPYSVSNQALAFFVNATSLKNDLNYVKSTLLHESTHMINFYQRSIVRGVDHDTWLEETSAMISEDILANISLGGVDKMTSVRIPAYLQSGGAVSYINWATDINTAGNSYAIGGSFGAFLNRKYGVAVAKKLITNCTDGVANSSSYTCLDSLIVSLGGTGIADEFIKFGTSIFGGMPGTNLPNGFGFPAASYVDSGTTYSFAAVNINTLAPTYQPAAATVLNSGFTATTHTYDKDTITSGTYTKNSVIVPKGTSVTLVIR